MRVSTLTAADVVAYRALMLEAYEPNDLELETKLGRIPL